MAETGRVVACEKNLLVLEIKRKSECEKCGACIQLADNSHMQLKALNHCNAKVGDTVEITLAASKFLSAVMYLYGIPLIVFLLAMIITWQLGTSEPAALGISVLAMAVSWVAVHFITKHINQVSYMPKAVRVIS